MLQVIRLVTPGRVDSLLAFDALPKRFLVGIKKRDESGTLMLREWLKQNGCIEKKINEIKNLETLQFEKVEFQFPFTYMIEYKTINTDKERWADIVSYVRRVVDPSVRLLDKIEDMAKQASKDANSEFTLEPQDIPIIPIPSEIIKPKAYEAPIEQEVIRAETIAEKEEIEIKKRRGRPKKAVEV